MILANKTDIKVKPRFLGATDLEFGSLIDVWSVRHKKWINDGFVSDRHKKKGVRVVYNRQGFKRPKGNKWVRPGEFFDLLRPRTKTTMQQLEKLAQSIDGKVFETSSVTGSGVEEAFGWLLKEIATKVCSEGEAKKEKARSLC